ncbi:MAG: N-acetylmuramoyl-L-alanine amidase [Chlamydiota bacterium]
MKHMLTILFFLLTAFSEPQTLFAKKMTIIIDPGHGGKNIGARQSQPYCEEKKICLITALLAKKHLQKLGYHVVLTRKSDVFVSLEKRVAIAKQSKGDLFVSVHYNASKNKRAKGIEIFYYPSKRSKKKTNKSKKLAEYVLLSVIKKTKAPSRGVKKGNFHVIRNTTMPAVLLEGGFISNVQERKKLRSKAYINKIAKALAEGIHRYVKA